ncbi:Eukaryotic translation initiation factor 3 subunit D [Tetrabaena socialis]|uniref:Eukaryotic translation initiation factor 3 subunit D n=1 Tax=Tetrabaena socialis TaxID=47790 RepID=A0A2J8A7Y7_9CHLO|nr:Eukaryotic translation initiation factor 3 subunit D [Tetrabaena socialis]|eukprot:PNH08600.1 Eukaryotic translation initiation factor 3 subunit D [Tetrabaena socialis]
MVRARRLNGAPNHLQIDTLYDNLAVKKEKPLEKTKRIFRNVSTSDDPVMQQMAAAGRARVFAVDSILTHLMCMQSSKYGWDLLATRKVRGGHH